MGTVVFALAALAASMVDFSVRISLDLVLVDFFIEISMEVFVVEEVFSSGSLSHLNYLGLVTAPTFTSGLPLWI